MKKFRRGKTQWGPVFLKIIHGKGTYLSLIKCQDSCKEPYLGRIWKLTLGDSKRPTGLKTTQVFKTSQVW